MLRYHIQIHNANAHVWQISLRFTQQTAADFTLSLPNWVPGSYMIRDFSRHLIQISAVCNDEPVALAQLNKNTWHAAGRTGDWQIHYQIYAFDLSVRTSFLNTERGFFDGACLFLRHDQRHQEACMLAISGLPEDWDVATSLPVVDEAKRIYQAETWRQLIDHPVEMGTQMLRLPFQAAGIAHEIVISGYFGNFDQKRLLRDVRRICAAQQAFFGVPSPFKRYTFLLHVGHNVYGGLEHASSSALMADRSALPQKNRTQDDSYTTLLGLFSHEYFHAWNVKSIQPAAFARSNLNEEAYTKLLWAFEGITAYYDDLFLVRSGVIGTAQYLKLLAKNITAVQQTAGRNLQSLSDASLTAWNKFYKPDENSPNATVSYYRKGALAALCLDAYIRHRSHGSASLDNVMRGLYHDWQNRRQPLEEDEWIEFAGKTVELDLKPFQSERIDSVGSLPIKQALSVLGVGVHWYALPAEHGGDYVDELPETAPPPAVLGAKFRKEATGITLTHVATGSSAESAGLSAGDQLIAFNHTVLNDFDKQWARVDAGDELVVHFIRDGMLHNTILQAQPAPAETALLTTIDTRVLEAWLL